MITAGKGKARAVVEPVDTPITERSHLLPETSTSHGRDTVHPPPRPRRPYAFAGIVTLLSLLAGCGIILALLVHSLVPPDAEREALVSDAVGWRGPKSVQLVNVTDDGIWLEVEGWLGIDADSIIGISRSSPSRGAAWWDSLRRRFAHRIVAHAPNLRVALTSEIFVFPKHFSTPPLLSFHVPESIVIPLSTNVQDEPHTTELGVGHVPSWLTPVKSLVRVRLIASTGELLTFARRAWEKGDVEVMVGVRRVQVQPSSGFLQSLLKIVKEDLNLDVYLQVPALPHLPPPGSGPLDLAKLVTLKSYSLETSSGSSLYTSPGNGVLAIKALATLPNVLPDINATIGFGLPFAIFLPPDKPSGAAVKMAEVMTSPIFINPLAKDIEIRLQGRVVADLGKLVAISSSSLSLFLQKYLRGEDNPIVVQGLSSVPKSVAPISGPPSWLLHSLPTLMLPLSFPGPQPPPQIIRSVTIEKMRLTEQRGKMKASGIVIAVVEMPAGMTGVDVNVNAVRPDVLVFDGAAPDDDDLDDYPERAFGHINPPDFLESTTEQHPTVPNMLIVRAPLESVDLDILPGHDKVLSDFVGKVVFKGGALAGVKGTADVRLELGGVKGQVAVQDLPVKGQFWVGKQR